MIAVVISTGNLNTILVAIIGALGTGFAGYMVSRTSKQDKQLSNIEINVNSRLDQLLHQSKIDNVELGGLRERQNEQDKYGRRQGDDPEPTPPATPPATPPTAVGG